MSDLRHREIVLPAIQEALPDWDITGSGSILKAGFTYLPQSHALALDPDVTIVSGSRGAGKSHWYTYLADAKIRSYLSTAYKNLRITTAAEILQGFGASTDGSTPSPAIFKLIADHNAEAAWRCILGSVLELPAPFPQKGEWKDKAVWVHENTEIFETLLRKKDESLAAQGKMVMVLFDALDRVADDWKSIQPIANRLFRLALDARSLKAIRMKLFVRPDMLEDEAIIAFPDASKLIAKRIDLVWSRADLYALFFQRLGNTRIFSDSFRSYVTDSYSVVWPITQDGDNFILPVRLRTDEELQARLFHEITGPTMAGGSSGHKRGIPYSWLVNHLMDAHAQVSPRSFFAALYTASQTPGDDAWPYPLSPKKIQAGVAKASEIRKNEIVEDYPWVSKLMRPLGERKLIVPCSEGEIRKIWDEYGVVDSIKRLGDGADFIKLPPRRIADGPRGLIDDLKDLGIMQRLFDGRIQVPDVYRIAFGLGRKGGVRPLK